MKYGIFVPSLDVSMAETPGSGTAGSKDMYWIDSA